MNQIKTFIITLTMLGIVGAGPVFAGDTSVNTVGVNGYDLVTYQTDKRPLRGNGNYVSVHDSITYLFANEQNKAAFEKNPNKYLPTYGGWCAYGVAIGKKFSADPEVWDIVDGRLYLNLDNGIKKIWSEDIPGNIKKADKHWVNIKDKSPEHL
ncbi:MAG: YHS domain protein [Candidatus Dadabacteria bacterium]|nr:YHS domain protein [Candidatus Dadabacteria bacterium]NIS09642.1 YHS domain protein [Candidatus Dadabacteria bacterium]NIV42805.1 YHS domain protein [Candidatus Dadabacteria bacterium]NIX15492.1 YHS domain protein [Candidatus Dadabacteria bacterium]NIY22205.1 YHS domain protein [Candidatus Dadabacteria bacterium]